LSRRLAMNTIGNRLSGHDRHNLHHQHVRPIALVWPIALSLCASCHRGVAVGATDAPRVTVATPVPRFPAAMQAANVDGDVRLVLPIDATGTPQPAGVRLIGEYHSLFRSAVLDAVSQWRFAPAQRDDRAVPDSIRVHWAFVIASKDCPPPAFPAIRCGISASDTAALGAAQRSSLDMVAPGRLEGKTSACIVASRRTSCE